MQAFELQLAAVVVTLILVVGVYVLGISRLASPIEIELGAAWNRTKMDGHYAL